jgi:hypothetical protein
VRYWVYGGIALVIVINAVVLFSLIFRCHPVEKAWDTHIAGTCVKSAIIPYISAVASPVTDAFVFVLPIPIILHLNMERRKRVRLVAVFSVGLL